MSHNPSAVNDAVIFCGEVNYHYHSFKKPFLSQGCNRTSVRLSRKAFQVVKVNDVRGDAPAGNFENLSSQKCDCLHFESLSCYIYHTCIFSSQF